MVCKALFVHNRDVHNHHEFYVSATAHSGCLVCLTTQHSLMPSALFFRRLVTEHMCTNVITI